MPSYCSCVLLSHFFKISVALKDAVCTPHFSIIVEAQAFGVAAQRPENYWKYWLFWDLRFFCKISTSDAARG